MDDAPEGLQLTRFDRLALDKNSVRSFDVDGRMRVKVANISKANICPYRGDEIPGWEELGLDPKRIYQMFRAPEELKAGAPTFNGIQLLKKHVPVDADDHQMYDIVGCTGTEANFDGTYLTNSLSVWTKEGIDLIESGDQCELSCGYHYVPDMTPGNFGGMHYDGVMRNIEGNHVALVEEGRAGPDVVVGDSALIKREDEMSKPTRLQYSLLMRTAAAINPLLATDAKVNYAPLFKGVTTKNFKERKPALLTGIKTAIAGKTIAKDASVEHLAHMLDQFEAAPALADKSMDESVSGPQHRAMEAAAQGQSTLGIPENVGEEFAEADKGKTFGDSLRAWAKDKGFELADEDYAALDEMHKSCRDEKMPDAEDEDPDKKKEEEEGAADGDDGEAEDEAEGEKKDDDEDDGKKKPAAKDKQAKDKGKGAMDKKVITQDEVNRAIAAERARSREAVEARAFVRPYVGDVSLALDSAEDIYRATAKALRIEDAETVHASALKSLIKVTGEARKKAMASDSSSFFSAGPNLAQDAAASDTFTKMFPGASRIGAV